MAQKVLLQLKKKPIWPATSVDNIFDPKTNKVFDFSKIISVTNYTINGKGAENGEFTITPQDINAAAADHTHTVTELGAASAVHRHEIYEINNLEARLAGIGPGEAVEGGFAMTPLNNSAYPEPSSWNNNNN